MTNRSFAERAHEGLHKLPGMPEHSESARLNHHEGPPSRPLRNQPRPSPRINHRHNEPKVLVGWQNAIARFFGQRGK
jgi:hypothetical protein